MPLPEKSESDKISITWKRVGETGSRKKSYCRNESPEDVPMQMPTEMKKGTGFTRLSPFRMCLVTSLSLRNHFRECWYPDSGGMCEEIGLKNLSLYKV